MIQRFHNAIDEMQITLSLTFGLKFKYYIFENLKDEFFEKNILQTKGKSKSLDIPQEKRKMFALTRSCCLFRKEKKTFKSVAQFFTSHNNLPLTFRK